MVFVDLNALEVREPVPGYRARFVHGENMTLAYWDVLEGAEMPEHSHPHEQVATLVEGEFELVVAGEKRRLDRNTVAVIPPGVPHKGRAITRCLLIDAFHPVREDFKYASE